MANESTSVIVFVIQQPIQFGVTHELGYGFVQPFERTCSCRHWDLDQLPCHHAIAVARVNGVHYYTLCHNYYSKEWLEAAYARPINPVPGPKDWHVPSEVKNMIVLPSQGRRQAGRPKEIRIPSAGESRRKKKCGKCGERGHNRLRCPNLTIGGTSVGQAGRAGTSAEAVEDAGTSTEIAGEAGTSSIATGSMTEDDTEARVNAAPIGRVRTSRKCSLCGMTGHTRRRCDLQFPIPPSEDDGNL